MRTAQLWKAIGPQQWLGVLEEVFGSVSCEPRCADIRAEVGEIVFQVTFHDRPELSYWEKYKQGTISVHLGQAAEPTLEACTTFPVFVGTLLQDISIMEAAADELWDLRGSTEALMALSNLLPYVMLTFSAVVDAHLRQLTPREGDLDVRS